MKYKQMLSISFLLLTLSLGGCSKCQRSVELGSRDNPVKLYFSPSVDRQTISKKSEKLLTFLEKKTGYFFTTAIPMSYIALVEAFGSKQADLAVMNSFGYILANRKYQAQARFIVSRYGKTTYQGQIITHVDSGIERIADLKGKNFAFTDSASTSGFLLPYKMFKERKINLGNTVFAMKHDNVVTMVYQRQVDAGATYCAPPAKNGKIHDARNLVLTQFPDVAEKVKIIALTDPIPNDPLVFRYGMPTPMKEKIEHALLEYLKTAEGKKIFFGIYGIDNLMPANDSTYDSLRQMLNLNELQPEKILQELHQTRKKN